jgi:hypothetical protein
VNRKGAAPPAVAWRAESWRATCTSARTDIAPAGMARGSEPERRRTATRHEVEMRIGIIGSGKVGGTAARLFAGRHSPAAVDRYRGLTEQTVSSSGAPDAPRGRLRPNLYADGSRRSRTGSEISTSPLFAASPTRAATLTSTPR